MRISTSLSIVLIFSTAACVDRVFIDVGSTPVFSLVVDGHISQLPGPYSVTLTKAFDLESKISPKIPVTAKHVTISDNIGNSENLVQVQPGIYQTDSAGIRGTIGRIYKLRIELDDGRVYDSTPDTLLAPGKLDSIYYTLVQEGTNDFGDQYSYVISCNSSGAGKSNDHFLWNFTGTFQSDTTPELNTKGCVYTNGKCNYVPLCTGLRNVGGYTLPTAIFVRVGPCTCCTCWFSIFNKSVILSNDEMLSVGRFDGIDVGQVPLDQWVFQHKAYAQVNQLRLSNQAYDFWKAVRTQRDAVNSLFQPVTGKIPSNFAQLRGELVQVEGLFIATGISTKSLVITRDDVPRELLPDRPLTFEDICQNLWPNGTNVRPSFWVD